MDGVTAQLNAEGRAAPPGDYATWEAYMRDVEASVPAWDRRESMLLGKAMRLAPNISVFCALLEGQGVPPETLDPTWRKRYGL